MIFEEIVKEYCNFLKLKVKKNSYRTITNRINIHILPYFKNKKIEELTTTDYLNWQIQINNLDIKYSYKKNLHYCFVTFLNYCKIYHNLDRNVAVEVGNFKNTELEEFGKIYTLEEFNQFISVIDNFMYKVLFEFLYYTGVRSGELLALKFNDIDFDSNKISINKTATRFINNGKRVFNTPKSKTSNRIISIDNKLSSDIKELKEFYKNKYSNFNNDFFIFGGPEMIPFNTLSNRKNKYCSMAKLDRIKIHEFRHSHACLLFQNNVPIDEISYRLGHSTISMTMDIYLKYLPKNEKRVLDTLNSINI